MRLRILVLLTLVLLAGCGSDEEQDAVEGATTALTDTSGAAETLDDALDEAEDAIEGLEFTIDLDEQNGSGITGTATLSPTLDGTVEVEVELDGSDGGPHPAHIHEGSCADLDPTPAFPLEDVVDGSSATTVDVDISDITANEYAINVHESTENADVYVACGDVRNQ